MWESNRKIYLFECVNIVTYMTQDNYRSVRLPRSLVDKIENIVKKDPDAEFTSIADFLKHASRELMFKMRK